MLWINYQQAGFSWCQAHTEWNWTEASALELELLHSRSHNAAGPPLGEYNMGMWVSTCFWYTVYVCVCWRVTCQTFDPQVLCKLTGECHRSSVSDQDVVVESDSAQSAHCFKLCFPVAQSLHPRRAMPSHCLVLNDRWASWIWGGSNFISWHLNQISVFPQIILLEENLFT